MEACKTPNSDKARETFSKIRKTLSFSEVTPYSLAEIASITILNFSSSYLFYRPRANGLEQWKCSHSPLRGQHTTGLRPSWNEFSGLETIDLKHIKQFRHMQFEASLVRFFHFSCWGSLDWRACSCVNQFSLRKSKLKDTQAQDKHRIVIDVCIPGL